MARVFAWFRLDVRRRWRSLLVLALLIALASGTVLTSLAGALRGASAIDRLLDQTLPATVEVLPGDPQFDWDLVRDLPQVAAVGLTVWTLALVAPVALVTAAALSAWPAHRASSSRVAAVLRAE